MFRYLLISVVLIGIWGCGAKNSHADEYADKIIELTDNIDLKNGIKDETAVNFVRLVKELQSCDTSKLDPTTYNSLIVDIIEKICKGENEKSSPAKLGLLKGLVEDYLGHSESPVADNELYIKFIEGLRYQDPSLYNEEELEEAKQYRRGEIFPDITVSTLDGSKVNLYDIPTEGEILLFIEDPDCDYCEDLFRELTNDNGMKTRIENGEIIFLKTNIMEVYQKIKVSHLPTIYIIGKDGLVKEKNVSPQKLLWT